MASRAGGGAPGRRSAPAMGAPAEGDRGFTLIEVSVAGILAVAFILAASAAFGSAFRVNRGNNLRQQGTAVVAEQLEYVRSLTWTEVAMSSVNTGAPMLNESHTTLLGSKAGFTGNEPLIVLGETGLVAPFESFEVEGTTYRTWRYVTSGPGGLRRVVVLVTWTDDGVAQSLLSGTLIGEVTARANEVSTTTSTAG